MDRQGTRPVEPITLNVRLLGRIGATLDGRELRLQGRHAQALLALLALRPRPRSRESIAADLWPEADPGGTGSLRQALWLLRSAVAGSGFDPDAIVETDQESIAIRPTVRLDLDATRFERLVRDRPYQPEAALPLYLGDLAEGLGYECFASDRERLADAYEDALALAARARLAGGDIDGARSAADELLSRDPLREEAHEVLIRVYGAIGSRSHVLRQYRRLRAILEAEMGIEPLPETTAAFGIALDQTVIRSRIRAASTAFGPASPVAAYAGSS